MDDELNRYGTLLEVLELILDDAFNDAETVESFCAGGPGEIEAQSRRVADQLRQMRATLDGWHMAQGQLPMRERE